jgi:hypothetical protein
MSLIETTLPLLRVPTATPRGARPIVWESLAYWQVSEKKVGIRAVALKTSSSRGVQTKIPSPTPYCILRKKAFCSSLRRFLSKQTM